jgi:hypothetical protein
MDLGECRFYYAGEEMNFLVFSDGACRTTYLETIRLLPILASQVHAYAIEPGADSQWVVVRQTHGKKMDWRFFLRAGVKFLEHPPGEVPKQLRDKVLERCPNCPSSRLSLGRRKGPAASGLGKRLRSLPRQRA